MEINIIDIKANKRIKLTNFEKFKNINIGHKISFNYKNKYGTNKLIEGIICSVEHEINQDNESIDYKLNIKVY